MAKQQYESRVQNLVYTLEVGVGAKVLKTLLYIMFMLLLSVLFVATQYSGFNQMRSMDQAQLARRFAERGQLQTGVVRPASLWLLAENNKLMVPSETGARARILDHPDLVNAPLYPVVLGTAFRLFRTDFSPATGQKFSPEQWVIIPLNLLFCFLGALFLFLTGKMLFDGRTSLTAATVYFLSANVWGYAVGGGELPLALFLSILGTWCLVLALRIAREAGDEPRPNGWRFWLAALGGGAVMGLLFLTRYAAFAAFPGFLLVLWLGIGRRGWLPALGALLVFAAVVSPWITRNLQVSGTFFGLAPYTVIQDGNDTFLRSMHTQLADLELRRQIQARFLRVVPRALNIGDLSLGAGLSICLFISTFFYRFQRPVTRVLRWGLLLSFALLVAAAGIFGEDLLKVGHIFLPPVLLFGAAFFYILLDRLQIGVKIVSMAVVTMFIFVQALPMLFTIMPPRPWSYPPYLARDIAWVSTPFAETEWIVSDMPWATAWYGGTTSLYLPVNVDEFFEVHDNLHPVNALYFTTLTRDKRYHSDLVRGSYASWRPILDLGNMPRGFPLTFGFPLRQGEQVVLADHNRWIPEGN